MKLEIKHIAPYLPYGLRCKIVNEEKELIGTLYGVYADGSCVFDDIVESEHGFESIKPLLKPLSELSGEDWKFMGCSYTTGIEANIQAWCRDGSIRTDYFNYLVSEHYDIFELIDNGLAEVKG